jgi:hypothetical protein
VANLRTATVRRVGPASVIAGQLIPDGIDVAPSAAKQRFRWASGHCCSSGLCLLGSLVAASNRNVISARSWSRTIRRTLFVLARTYGPLALSGRRRVAPRNVVAWSRVTKRVRTSRRFVRVLADRWQASKSCRPELRCTTRARGRGRSRVGEVERDPSHSRASFRRRVRQRLPSVGHWWIRAPGAVS